MANAINLSDTTPAPPGGATNITWQKDASTPPNVSGYVTLPTPTSFPNPKGAINILDDFLGGGNAGATAASGLCGMFGWAVTLGGSGTVANVDDSSNGGVGTEKLDSPTSSDTAAIFLPVVGTAEITYAGNLFDTYFYVRCGTLSNFTGFFGMWDNGSLTSGYPQNGIYIDLASGKGHCVNASADSNVSLLTMDTSYHRYRIRCAVAGTILFSVDGGAESSITTNVPSAKLGMGFRIASTNASDHAMYIDYVWHTVNITR